MAYATPQNAVAAKLRAGATNTAVGGRVNPQFSTQEPALPFVVVKLTGSDPSPVLSGKRTGRPYAATVQVDVYAPTESVGAAVGAVVLADLCPDGAPWQDKARGVHGCFPGDVSDEATDDPYRVYGQAFRVWFQPPS